MGKNVERGSVHRLAIVDPDRCKPSQCALECKKCCPVNRIGKPCITVNKKDKISVISEILCVGCGCCVKKCPFNAISIVNVPKALSKDASHRYGANGFKLHKLPIPRLGSVLGLVGSNGVGKSTCLRVLSGDLRPNLGLIDPDWMQVLDAFKGSELFSYFTKLLSSEMVVSLKKQYVDTLPVDLGCTESTIVSEVLVKCQDSSIYDFCCSELELFHLMNKRVVSLSGGEMQRLAIASCVLKPAQIFFLDEPSSFLDVKQRLSVCKLIRKLVRPDVYIIVVEHDLAVLDAMCDFGCVLYGMPGVYGVVTAPYVIKQGVNCYLSGYIPSENVRFRQKELTFAMCERPSESVDREMYTYDGMTHCYKTDSDSMNSESQQNSDKTSYSNDTKKQQSQSSNLQENSDTASYSNDTKKQKSQSTNLQENSDKTSCSNDTKQQQSQSSNLQENSDKTSYNNDTKKQQSQSSNLQENSDKTSYSNDTKQQKSQSSNLQENSDKTSCSNDTKQQQSQSSNLQENSDKTSYSNDTKQQKSQSSNLQENSDKTSCSNDTKQQQSQSSNLQENSDKTSCSNDTKQQKSQSSNLQENSDKTSCSNDTKQQQSQSLNSELGITQILDDSTKLTDCVENLEIRSNKAANAEANGNDSSKSSFSTTKDNHNHQQNTSSENHKIKANISHQTQKELIFSQDVGVSQDKISPTGSLSSLSLSTCSGSTFEKTTKSYRLSKTEQKQTEQKPQQSTDGTFNLEIKGGTFSKSEIIVLLGENGTGKSTYLNLLKQQLSEKKQLTISVKPQKIIPKYKGTMKDLFMSKIRSAFLDTYFQNEVLKPLNIDYLLDNKLTTMSGGELQRVAIALTLGRKADIYMFDEPSAFLDCDQRIAICRIIKKFCYTHSKTCFVVEHDLIVGTYLADKIVVFSGSPGVQTTASEPLGIEEAMNMFLKRLDVTFRRDFENLRPRVNKHGSAKDREQKEKGVFRCTSEAETRRGNYQPTLLANHFEAQHPNKEELTTATKNNQLDPQSTYSKFIKEAKLDLSCKNANVLTNKITALRLTLEISRNEIVRKISWIKYSLEILQINKKICESALLQCKIKQKVIDKRMRRLMTLEVKILKEIKELKECLRVLRKNPKKRTVVESRENKMQRLQKQLFNDLSGRTYNKLRKHFVTKSRNFRKASLQQKKISLWVVNQQFSNEITNISHLNDQIKVFETRLCSFRSTCNILSKILRKCEQQLSMIDVIISVLEKYGDIMKKLKRTN